MNAVLRQFSQYDIAIANFRTNYNAFPGDDTFFSANGNNNGNVTSADGSLSNFDGEIANFWPHLSLSGMLKENGFSYVLPSSGNMMQCDDKWVWAQAGRHNVPCVNMDVPNPEGFGGNFWNGGRMAAVAFTVSGVGYYQLQSRAGYIGNNNRAAPYYYYYLLDAKMDDGLPYTGDIVLASYALGTATSVAGGQTTASSYYKVAIDTAGTQFWKQYPNENLRIKMNIRNGSGAQ